MKYKDVDGYIEKNPQRKILEKVRKIIKKNFKGIKEEMKWGVPVYDGGKFYLAGLRDKVNMGFAINGLTKQEQELFEGGGKTMRHIKIFSEKEIDEKKIVKLMKLVEKKAVCEC